MRWVAIFQDQPQMMEHRAKYVIEHIAYIKKHQGEILIGGGLKNNPDEIFVGAMWVLEVGNRDKAIQLIEADPFFNPKYRSYQLFTWGKILEDVNVLL
jgi:uncharacterized protein YciI